MPRRDSVAGEGTLPGIPPNAPRGETTNDGSDREGRRTESRDNGDGNGDAAAGNSTARVGEEIVELSIEDLVEEAEINLDAPCANLPLLRAQELKIIGRCVTFLGETTVEGERVLLHYEGVVAMITKDTVMLLQVRRYTKEDFLKYQEMIEAEKRDEHKKDDHQELHGEMDRNGNGRAHAGNEEMMNFHAASEATSNDDVHHDMHVVDCNILAAQETRENAGMPEPDPPLTRQNRLLGTRTMGPVPFMTFSRRRIHNVVFGHDPQNSLYSIFQNPSRRYFDMQCLRMFVRRYLVHTSQGNNPRKINLRPFIEWRCNCKGIADELLVNVAKQELAYLIKTEREMAKAAERLANNRRNFFHTYQPTHRLFRATGILFLTRIPAQTFSLAILEMLVSLLLLGFSAYSFATAPPILIYGYVKDYTFSVTFAGIVSLLASGMTAFHSLRMRIPLTFSIHTALRLVAATVAIALDTMTLVMIGGAVSHSHILGYLFRLAQESAELCYYYALHNCTGFGEICGPDNMSPICMQHKCPSNRTVTCTQPLTATLIRIFIPFIAISMVLVALFMIDHLLHYRLLQASRLLMARM
ncbi:hypothetical protein C3747_29g116 [Trypanosoma cruzi]|uniref:Uncharacterized protein n=1 Tax=Trypanosoma cruzi TaxID=5693 RepID=A0A2V2X4W1_TRYCR|nr:hypothetical protein C3747_29g116 [Trypanosoma cruzi]